MKTELRLTTNEHIDNLILLTEFIGKDDFSRVTIQSSNRKEKVTTLQLDEYVKPIMDKIEEKLQPIPTDLEKKILSFNYMLDLMEKVRYKTLVLTNTKGEKLDVIKLYT